MADSYGSVPPPGQSGGGAVDFSKLIQLAKERAAQVAKGVTPPPPPPIVASGANAEGMCTFKVWVLLMFAHTHDSGQDQAMHLFFVLRTAHPMTCPHNIARSQAPAG